MPASLVLNLLVAVSGLLALVTCNQLLGTWWASKSRTSFDMLPAAPGADSRRVFILFHALWGGPARFEWIPEYLTKFGRVLLVSTGGNDDLTPADTLRYLDDNGMLQGHELYVGAFSKGAINLAYVAEMLLSLRIVPGLIINDGAGDPDAIIWPMRWLPALLRVLKPGPVVHVIWKTYWFMNERRAQRMGDQFAIENAAWCRSVHPGAVITGARKLMERLDLRDGAFAVVRKAVIFRNVKDHMIAKSDLWKRLVPNAVELEIPVPGHGVFTLARTIYEQGLEELLAALCAAGAWGPRGRNLRHGGAQIPAFSDTRS